MKLDLVEINRLSPPSLWQLAPIRALIETLLVVIKSKSGGQFTGLYKRMLVQQSKNLREKIRENLNMRIKAWIMHCPARIAWVRSIIGEAAIRRWRMNRLADYALTKYFGDWKSKWPNGFNQHFNQHHEKQPRTLKFQGKLRPYNWKPFTLTRIFNVERFLYGRDHPILQVDELPAAYQKLWNVEIQDRETLHIKGAQPRGQRSFKPVEFTPDELVSEAAAGLPEDEEYETSGAAIAQPLKPPRLSVHPPPQHPVPTSSREPPDTK